MSKQSAKAARKVHPVHVRPRVSPREYPRMMGGFVKLMLLNSIAMFFRIMQKNKMRKA